MQSSLRLFVLLIIVGAFFLMRYLRVVPAGHIMVVDVFGKVRSEALPSGLHLINPFAALHRMSVQTQEGKKRRLYSGRSGGNSADRGLDQSRNIEAQVDQRVELSARWN